MAGLGRAGVSRLDPSGGVSAGATQVPQCFRPTAAGLWANRRPQPYQPARARPRGAMGAGAVSPADLPPVNACLNGISAIFLGAGYYFIRRKNQAAHRNCMITAFVASTLFLA